MWPSRVNPGSPARRSLRIPSPSTQGFAPWRALAPRSRPPSKCKFQQVDEQSRGAGVGEAASDGHPVLRPAAGRRRHEGGRPAERHWCHSIVVPTETKRAISLGLPHAKLEWATSQFRDEHYGKHGKPRQQMPGQFHPHR